MNCKTFRRESDELETGQLLSSAARSHVDSCQSCRHFQSEHISLRQLIGSLGEVSAPPDFHFKLRARLATANSEGSRKLGRARFAPGLKAISVAASFALLLAATVVFKQFQSGSNTQSVVAVNQSVANGRDAGQQQTIGKSSQSAVATVSHASVHSEGRGDFLTTDVVSRESTSFDKVVTAKTARAKNAGKINRATIFDNDSALRGNPQVIMPAQPSVTYSGERDATASLHVPAQPFKLILHDRQGTMRSISLEPVVFGSQDVLERAARLRPSVKNDEGIW